MLRKNFKSFLSQLDLLTHNQKQYLLKYFKNNACGNQGINLIESHFENKKPCPYCNSERHQKWGKANGLQRFRCKECMRTFNALTASPFSKLRHKKQWLLYCDCLNNGLTIRKSAEICNINPSTAFRWRHRFLSNPMHDTTQKMVGIVEADETFFSESCKGSRKIEHRKPRKRGRTQKKYKGQRVPVLLVRDRNATVADFVLPHVERKIIHDHLRPLMSAEVVLCTDGSNIYKSFAKATGIPHKRIIAIDKQYVIDDIFHIQNLNAYTSRLKSWMKRFNGVATKYLANYLAWRRMLEKQKGKLSNEWCFHEVLRYENQQITQT